MLPDRVSNPGPLTYESDALPIALRGPAPVLERPTYLDCSRARAYCACSRCGWGLFAHFFLTSITSLFFLPLSGRRPDIDCNTVSKGR